MTTENFDPFDDSDTSDTAATDAQTVDDAANAEVIADQQQADQTAGDDKSGTPPENQEADSQNEKMIPEHRFKAALKAAAEETETWKARAQKAEAQPVPDKENDPEGYNLYVRMEASKEVMREMRTDYEDVIKHYQAMAKENPRLNDEVAAAPLPAKFAYDLAKQDMEMRDLRALKSSDEWKEFQEYKKSKASQNPESDKSKQVANALSAVPNLNRQTNASPKGRQEDDDQLFAGAL